MLINVSYSLGDSSLCKYFEDFSEMINFIEKYLELSQSDFNTLEIGIYFGKEEARVRKVKDANDSGGEHDRN